MFCKKCGTKIDDDSIFCCKCGARQSVEQAENSVDAPKPADEGTKIASTPSPSGTLPPQDEEYKSGCGSVLIIFFVFAFLVSGCIFLTALFGKGSCSSGGSSRRATISDIDVDTDLNIMELGVDVVITPKADISDLELTLVYCDNTGKEIKTQTLYIGSVEDGVKTKKTVHITNFSLSEALRISSVKIRVSGGAVE